MICRRCMCEHDVPECGHNPAALCATCGAPVGYVSWAKPAHLCSPCAIGIPRECAQVRKEAA